MAKMGRRCQPWIFLNLVLLVFSDLLINADAKEMNVFVGDSVSLPCRVDIPQCGELHSVKWYRDTSRIYVFSQDSGIKKAEGDAIDRMSVEYKPSDMDALLKISNVKIDDEAYYKCEITYLEVRENCDIVQVIKLNTLVPPQEIVIRDSKNRQLINETILDASNEGTEIELVCEAHRGRPIPTVAWYNGTEEMEATHTESEDEGGLGTGVATLRATLSRGDVQTKYECRVESIALEQPIVSTLYPNVSVKLTRLELTETKGHVTEGSNVNLICDAFGARPAAVISWSNGTSPVAEEYITMDVVPDRNGTFTTKSELNFKSTLWENGRAFHCRAENDVMKEQGLAKLHQVTHIEVYYKPVVTVTPENSTKNETDEVLLMCTYIANPQKLLNVVWKKDGKVVSVDKEDKYEGGTIDNPPLRILNITKEDMGRYTCELRNEVGSQVSETSAFLNVIYPPVVSVIMDPSTPVKSLDCTNVTLYCKVEDGNPIYLQTVRWLLNGVNLTEAACNVAEYMESPTCNKTRKCKVDISMILLERVQESFSGNYSCQAENDAGWGEISESKELVVYYPPSGIKLRFEPEKVIKEGLVTLHCEVADLGLPENVTYVWYRGGHEVPKINTKSWSISPVNLQTRSNFSCIAVNEGGSTNMSTVYVDVLAPPAFIKAPPGFKTVHVENKTVSLTCRIECYPNCSIEWRKNNELLNVDQSKLYYVKTKSYAADLQKGDFESIESTLHWNMSAWPNNELDRNEPISSYTCSSVQNEDIRGVNATITLFVEYKPEHIKLSKTLVDVEEYKKPEVVVCNASGRPNITYTWIKDKTDQVLPASPLLELTNVSREDAGGYTCIASNIHGSTNATMYLRVLYAPLCSITEEHVDGQKALICLARGNPDKMTFKWYVSEGNSTEERTATIRESDKRTYVSYLEVDASVTYTRTFVCYSQNDVGNNTCQTDILGSTPWWQRLDSEKMIIIIASIIGLIVCVIIICLIIIVLCRRKRANNKYSNQVEMEERENPDGQSPDSSTGAAQSRWPLRPGVLVHVNKIHSLRPMITASQFKTKAVSKTSRFFKCKRNKGRAYARLERIKDLLVGGRGDPNRMPIGITHGPTGVVTFKKVEATAPTVAQTQPMMTRKRKKPGYAPNSSSIENKTGLGVAPPDGGLANPNNAHPDDKGFYENLPFHGMQNPPNKPISVIAPFMQANTSGPLYAVSSSKLSLYSQHQTPFSTPFGTYRDNAVKRNQSFSGFQAQNMNPNFNFNRNVPSVLHHLPPNFHFMRGNNTVGAIYTRPVPTVAVNRFQSFGNLNQDFRPNGFFIQNPFSVVGNNDNRVVGRRDIRTTASGINVSKVPADIPKKCVKSKPQTIVEKKFGSLEIKKHKCYSPTFYSMRCKKHAKKRPVIYALPKKVIAKSDIKIEDFKVENFENLTDSIEIFEQNSENATNELMKTVPKPAPRCKRHKTEIIYQNISDTLKKQQDNLDSSNDGSDKAEAVVTQALVHESVEKLKNYENSEDLPVPQILTVPSTNIPPTIKVSPNFVKPKTESPKGALFLQIQAKRKISPPTDPPPKPPETKTDEQNADSVQFIPEMPILDTKTKWNFNMTNSQNAFYTLTTPHYRHPKSGISPHYSSTIPHQKHLKLLPRALFQEQQPPKSKSFSSKTKQKKHFQVPLQKCHSFKFQTAESYFQPIKNVHEENFMRNGYLSDLGPNYTESRQERRHQKREKHKSRGSLFLKSANDFHENLELDVKLQYPQPTIGVESKPNGVVYADLDMPKGGNKRQTAYESNLSQNKQKNVKPKTEYATLKFNEVGQEIDV